MKKKLVSLALIGMCLAGLCGCSSNGTSKSSSTSSDLDTDMVKIVTDAAKKLSDTYTDYVVSSEMTAPDGNITFIEVAHNGTSYTEYSVDDDNNVGTITYGSQDSISYTMTDYVTKDGKYYMFQSGSDGNDVVYSLPDTYKSYISDRMMLYANDLAKSAISIKEVTEDVESESDDNEELTTYKMVVKSSAVKKLLGASSYGIYSSIQSDSGKDSNIGKLCSYYLTDLDMNLTFSDANVVFGIDQNGILKYMALETGGLGTRLYLTKEVVATSNSNIRDTPDLSSAKDFTSTLSDLAEYVSQYDNYDDAVEALSNYSSDSSTDSEEDSSDDSDSELTSDETETETETSESSK
jgi:hypothetical protein